MKRTILLLCLAISLLLTACATVDTIPDDSSIGTSSPFTDTEQEKTLQVSEVTDDNTETDDSENPTDETDGTTKEEKVMTMTIGDTPVQVEWEDNESVTALKELVETARSSQQELL